MFSNALTAVDHQWGQATAVSQSRELVQVPSKELCPWNLISCAKKYRNLNPSQLSNPNPRYLPEPSAYHLPSTPILLCPGPRHHTDTEAPPPFTMAVSTILGVMKTPELPAEELVELGGQLRWLALREENRLIVEKAGAVARMVDVMARHPHNSQVQRIPTLSCACTNCTSCMHSMHSMYSISMQKGKETTGIWEGHLRWRRTPEFRAGAEAGAGAAKICFCDVLACPYYGERGVVIYPHCN